MNTADFIARWRFSLLLIALISNILLAPLISNLESGSTANPLAAQIAFTFLLVIIVFVVGHHKKVIASYTVLAFIALTLSWINLSNHSETISILSHGFSFVTLIVAITLIIKETILIEEVSLDTIAGSLCAYLLLGFAFASIYALIDIVEPSSFISSIQNDSGSISLATSDLDRIYFSFVTLLTIGYGDIVPHSAPAKLTTIIEGFLGQVYLVVLIARLVGTHVSQRSLK